MNVLAIDQGTSATKALVVSAERAVLGRAVVPVHPRFLADGGVEQDPEALWASVVTAGRAAVAAAGVRLDAVGFANQGETVLQWDRSTGDALSAAITWQDRRSLPVCQALAAHAERLTAITGLPVDPYFAAPKMRWLCDQHPTTGVCTTTDTWLLHRLTGAFVTDAATASRTLLLDLHTTTWSTDACRAFEFDPTALPAVVDCAGAIGSTTAFGGDVPVAGLAVDQQAALFGQHCHAAGDAKCTYGTGAFLLATTGPQPRRSQSGLVASVAWRLDGRSTYCLDGQVYCAGAALDWLQRLGLLAAPTELDWIAGSVPHSAGVCFVPALAGHAAPFWKPSARGTWTGLGLATERGHLVRAFIDGLAAQVAWLVRATERDLGTPLVRLRVDGGLAHSQLLVQTQADLLQIPVEVGSSTDATALGVAALARLGMGGALDPAAAVGPWTPAAIFTPQINADEAAARLDAWQRAAHATMELTA